MMLDVSSTNTTQWLPATVRVALFAGILSTAQNPTTAPSFSGNTLKVEFSNSTSLVPSVPYLQVIDVQATATTVPPAIDDVPLDQLAPAQIAARAVIDDTLGEIQTEESLERFHERVSELIGIYHAAALSAMDGLLLRAVTPPSEPLARRFLNILGDHRTQAMDALSHNILIRNLNSPYAGRRSAAASALGSFPDHLTLVVLERRAKMEVNPIVHATLKAHIRTIRANGISTSQTI